VLGVAEVEGEAQAKQGLLVLLDPKATQATPMALREQQVLWELPVFKVLLDLLDP
jgi:hypothetical protein